MTLETAKANNVNQLNLNRNGGAININNRNDEGEANDIPQDIPRDEAESFVTYRPGQEEPLDHPLSDALTRTSYDFLRYKDRMFGAELNVAAAEVQLKDFAKVHSIRTEIEKAMAKDGVESFDQLKPESKKDLKDFFNIDRSQLEKISNVTDEELREWVGKAKQRYGWSKFFAQEIYRQLIEDIKAIKESIKAASSQ